MLHNSHNIFTYKYLITAFLLVIYYCGPLNKHADWMAKIFAMRLQKLSNGCLFRAKNSSQHHFLVERREKNENIIFRFLSLIFYFAPSNLVECVFFEMRTFVISLYKLSFSLKRWTSISLSNWRNGCKLIKGFRCLWLARSQSTEKLSVLRSYEENTKRRSLYSNGNVNGWKSLKIGWNDWICRM